MYPGVPYEYNMRMGGNMQGGPDQNFPGMNMHHPQFRQNMQHGLPGQFLNNQMGHNGPSGMHMGPSMPGGQIMQGIPGGALGPSGHMNQMGPHMGQIPPNINQGIPNMQQLPPNMNQIPHNMNIAQMPPNMNQGPPIMPQMQSNINPNNKTFQQLAPQSTPQFQQQNSNEQ